MVNREKSQYQDTLDEHLRSLRKEYSQATLDEADCGDEPLALLERWVREAVEAQVAEPNAMVLATVDAGGRPSARAVLLKQLSSEGIVFFTNYLSRKGQELAANSEVAATFVWAEIERQVRIEGSARRVEREQSEKYFYSRPRASQLAALASQQSRPLSSRRELEEAYRNLEKQVDGLEVPLPEDWGGFLIVPRQVEFWQGRESRLHDRIVFVRSRTGGWERSRLWP